MRDKPNIDFTTVALTTLIYLFFYSVLIYYSLSKARNVPKENGAILGKKEYDFTESHIAYKDKDSEAVSNGQLFKND